ncbi:hypothetical protein KJ682_17510 [bacterium]|nr:hypothetical protein [bacterium]
MKIYPQPLQPDDHGGLRAARPERSEPARVRPSRQAGQTLLSGEVVAQGRHEAHWDGRDASGRQAASGTYLFRLEAGGQAETRRAVLIK